MDPSKKRNIVIVGGGIIGSTTAYFLTRHPRFDPALHTITILEGTAVASGASGKAGGLLALWAYPQCLVPLSFELHAELAAEHDGATHWGYRKVNCGSLTARVSKGQLNAQKKLAKERRAAAAAAETVVEANTDTSKTEDEAMAVKNSSLKPKTCEDKEPAHQPGDKDWEKLPKQNADAEALLSSAPDGLPPDLDWIDIASVTSYDEMGQIGYTDTAQVHPYHFTTSIAALAEQRGVEVRTRAIVRTIIQSNQNGVESVEYEDRENGETKRIDGVTDVVVTAGPWTGKLLPRSKIESLRAHSVVWKADVSPYAVFTDIELPREWAPEHRASVGQKRKHRGRVDPEIYARPFGEVYACGEPDRNIPLPEAADLVQCDESQCDDLAAYTATISPVLAAAPVTTKQACYLPRHVRGGDDAGPLIGPTTIPGLWIASGHTCWGIQNGPATGKLMSEYLLDGQATSADIEELNPQRWKI